MEHRRRIGVAFEGGGVILDRLLDLALALIGKPPAVICGGAVAVEAKGDVVVRYRAVPLLEPGEDVAAAEERDGVIGIEPDGGAEILERQQQLVRGLGIDVAAIEQRVDMARVEPDCGGEVVDRPVELPTVVIGVAPRREKQRQAVVVEAIQPYEVGARPDAVLRSGTVALAGLDMAL